MRAPPLDPHQTITLGAQCRRCVEVRPFSQNVASAVDKVERHQAVNVVVFLDGENLPAPEPDIAVALVAVGQCERDVGVEGLEINLLIGFVHEHHGFVAQAERASAIFINPAARAEAIRRQARGDAVAPAPDARSGVLRAEFVPEKAGGTDAQFSEIDPCRHSLGSREQVRILR